MKLIDILQRVQSLYSKGLNSDEILEIISKKYKNIIKVPRDNSSPAQDTFIINY